VKKNELKLKILEACGPKRGGARVLEDRQRDEVVVRWTVHGLRRTKRFSRTPAGRREAKAFAHGLVAELSQPDRVPVPTVRALWLAYVEAEFSALRPRSQRIYGERWRLFERFAAHDTAADAVTAETLDKFRKALREQDYAPNQVRAHVQMVKLVYRWARDPQRHLVISNVPDYKFKLPKDQRASEPEEFTREEYEKLVAATDAHNSRTWRPWALLMLIGHQGVRVNAALHLRWSDIAEGRITWPSATDKVGKTWIQPIRDGAQSALLTAQAWRGRDQYEGPWVFYRPRTMKARKTRADAPYTVQALWAGLRQAESKAGVAHKPLRALHGLRKMVAGDVLESTGDAKVALDFIGDTDFDLIRTYLKRRERRLDEVVERMDRGAPDPKGTGEIRMAPVTGKAPSL
jgi:integrase